MVIYEPRRYGWSERFIQIESVEQMEKLFVYAVLIGGHVELENDWEAEALKSLLPWIPFKAEAERVINAYEVAKEVLSKLCSE